VETVTFTFFVQVWNRNINLHNFANTSVLTARDSAVVDWISNFLTLYNPSSLSQRKVAFDVNADIFTKSGWVDWSVGAAGNTTSQFVKLAHCQNTIRFVPDAFLKTFYRLKYLFFAWLKKQQFR